MNCVNSLFGDAGLYCKEYEEWVHRPKAVAVDCPLFQESR